MEGLHESNQPEVLFLIQFALSQIVEYFETHFNSSGGFGQYTWTPEIVCSQLAEVQRLHISKVSVSPTQ